MEMKHLGVWCAGLEAQEETSCQFWSRCLGAHSYILPSEVNLSSGWGTPLLRGCPADGF